MFCSQNLFLKDVVSLLLFKSPCCSFHHTNICFAPFPGQFSQLLFFSSGTPWDMILVKRSPGAYLNLHKSDWVKFFWHLDYMQLLYQLHFIDFISTCFWSYNSYNGDNYKKPLSSFDLDIFWTANAVCLLYFLLFLCTCLWITSLNALYFYGNPIRLCRLAAMCE